ncbi:MAG: laccase domain-containing protein, partial [Myxococcota bacterium]
GARPGDVRAAVGPCICGACYEVGEEVLAGVGRVAPGTTWRVGARNVDLGEANAAILRAEGVVVDRVARCTRCDEGLWSYRRDGASGGRQVGAIRL